jgi:hypothetical protein
LVGRFPTANRALQISILIGACLAASAAPPAVDYPNSVAPLLQESCGQCHSAKSKTSGFSIATVESVLQGGNKYGRAVIPGHPEQSPLIKLLKGQLAPRMPMGNELPAAEIARIEDWIKSLPAAAASGKSEWRWPYQKPVNTAPPEVANAAWVRNPIDAFILKKLEENQLAPAPPAAKNVLCRRVYFDLVGVPPTPGEMSAFLADKTPAAYEKLLDKLLADPRYGERWGRHWLDLARYGETSGLEGDGAIGNAWRYRDWVIDAFNSNMPYDRFVLLQLAGGDEHSKTRNNYQPDPQGYIPTGFLRVAPWDRSNLVAADVRQNYLNEVTTVTGSVFLGLTIGCARCHDHKYDPIPTRDFYRLQSFFNTTQAGTPLEVPFKNKAFAEIAKKKVEEYEERLHNGPEKKELDEFEAQLLKKLIAVRTERAKAKNEYTKADLRLELALKKQRIFTEPERANHQELQAAAERTGDTEEQQALDACEAKLLVKLKSAYAKGDVDPAARFQSLAIVDVEKEATAKYSGESIFSAEEKARFGELTAKLDVFRNRAARWKPSVLGVTQVPGPPSGPDIAPIHVLKRGDYRQPAEAVEPGFPSVITGNFEPAVLETDRYRQYPTRGWRMTLAKWIVSRDNPLTARVMVNRIWQHHFGEGIIRTTSDFGKNGDRPSHPELLDFLAVKFMDDGWDIKAMHKLMLMSNTYRQAPENPKFNESTKDPDNRLLWRFNRRRLEAEAIRDSILQVSGRLNPERGGPSVFPPLPDDLADFARYGRTGGLMWEPNEKDEDGRRSSVYIFQRRSLPLPVMASFDAIVFSESCERRSTTTTPLQSLSMMNGNLMHEESEYLAKRLEKDAGANRSAQVRRAFEIILNRPAKPEEVEKFSKFSGPLDAICRVLLSSNEFLYVE